MNISESNTLKLVKLAYEDICKNCNFQIDFVEINPPLFGKIRCFSEKFLQCSEAIDPNDLLGKCPYEAAKNGLLPLTLTNSVRERDKQALKIIMNKEFPQTADLTLEITDEHLDSFRSDMIAKEENKY